MRDGSATSVDHHFNGAEVPEMSSTFSTRRLVRLPAVLAAAAASLALVAGTHGSLPGAQAASSSPSNATVAVADDSAEQPNGGGAVEPSNRSSWS